MSGRERKPEQEREDDLEQRRPGEIDNPGDPGPPVLVPPASDDPREDPKLPREETPPPGV